MSPSFPTLGILGGGQLAAMLTAAANRVGVDVHVYRDTASADRCTADRVTTASFDDTDELEKFAASVDAVTVETENIPVSTLQLLEELVPVRPSSLVVEICQDRLREKQFLTDTGVQVARFGEVNSADDLAEQIAYCGGKGILKTRRFGYDGKGQTRVKQGDDFAGAWHRHGANPSVLEQLVPFDFEISVIGARTEAGDVAMYDPGRNEHREGILRTTEVPARLAPGIRDRALAIAATVLTSLNYIGVLGIEFFVVGDELLVNELAPRVHNSGHWTQQGCVVDQFEQHVRAVMGYPLGATERHSDVVMTNLIGDDLHDDSRLGSGSSRVHLYGKREIRPGRKMGHLNTVLPLTSDGDR